MTTDARPSGQPDRRIAGLGSIYGKTVRDSRRAAIVVGGLAAMFMIGTGAPYAPRISQRWSSGGVHRQPDRVAAGDPRPAR